MAPEDNPADDDEHGECRYEVYRLKGLLDEETAIVNRVWKALGISTMDQAGGKAIDELVMDVRRRSDRWEMLHDARTVELKRTQEVLAAHRRFHSKTGCPGRPECYVCAEEEFNIDLMEYKGTP